MHPIVTITLNPTIDFATNVPACVPGPKLRCDSPQIDPGGGGINVARALRILGSDATALFAGGGVHADALRELLDSETIRYRLFVIAGQTRQSLTVTENQSGQQYRFVFPGPDWTDQEVAGFADFVATNLPESALVVLSGSQPPGVPAPMPSVIAKLVRNNQGRLIVDTSGAALDHVLEGGKTPPFLVRMNQREAEKLAGREFPDARSTADFALQMISNGVAEAIAIAHGDRSIIATTAGCWESSAPPVPVVSKVGAGDSFVAGLCWCLAQDEPLAEALRFATATASAAVMTDATQLCEKDTVERLLAACTVRQI